MLQKHELVKWYLEFGTSFQHFPLRKASLYNPVLQTLPLATWPCPPSLLPLLHTPVSWPSCAPAGVQAFALAAPGAFLR